MIHYNFIKQEVSPNTISDVKVDASFRKIPKNGICFHVWKIDDDRLEAVPQAQFGTFYDHCAYIIYAASPVGSYVNQNTITREPKTPNVQLERFIHFWLGEKVTEQKRANVSHKIQELDSYFDNVATMYRETQDNESARFLSYFKRGVTVRSGALMNDNDTNRLFRLYGRKWLRCTEMPSISWEHFCADCIMLLKMTDNHIYLWIGRSSSFIERRDAIELATTIQADYADITIVDDGYEQSLPDRKKSLWNSLLPVGKRLVAPLVPVLEKTACNKLKIYKCGYRNSRLHLDQLDVVIPTKEDLNDSTTIFVLDGTLSQGIWMWVGNQTTAADTIGAMGNGRAFAKKKKYSNCTPVIRVIEGHEPIEFTRLFPNWHNEWNDSKQTFKPVSTSHGKLDGLTLCQRPKMAADTQLIDDGSGERKVYQITRDQVIEMSTKKSVMFSTNGCYVVEYTVVYALANPSVIQNVGIQNIIYQWNGSDAPAEAINKSERFAKNAFEKLPEKSMFVQMCEFDETPHFLQIFDGKLIIVQENKDSQLINNNNNNNNNNNKNNNINNNVVKLSPTSKTTIPQNDYFVLKVYGDASYNSKAVEVYPLTSMRSKDCYVLRTPTNVWVWCGQSSTGDSREMAKNVGSVLGEGTLVMEGKEPKEFWRNINEQMNHSVNIDGGNTSGSSTNGSPHGSNGSSSNGSNGSPNSTRNSISPINVCGSGYLTAANTPKTRLMAQLFVVWAQRNRFCSQEIIGFEQSDLAPECIYVLDVGLTTYVWLGAQAPSIEKDKYLKLAQYYLETVPIARRPTTAVAVVRQSGEPNVFKGFFENWKDNFWNNYVTYEQKRQMFGVHTSNGGSPINGSKNGESHLPTALLSNLKEFDSHTKYPIALLQQEIVQLPAEVDPLKRELHLTHDDFVSAFNMNYWEYDELPLWKKQELKKKFKLF